jgi:hypothetical protein
MKVRWTAHFARAYSNAPEAVQRAFDKQVLLLHDDGKDRWQGRVNQDWRFYFVVQGDTYVLQDIIRHPK